MKRLIQASRECRYVFSTWQPARFILAALILSALWSWLIGDGRKCPRPSGSTQYRCSASSS